MQAVIVLTVLGLVAGGMVAALLGLLAWARTSRLERRLDALAAEIAGLKGAGAPAGTSAPRPAVPAPPRPAPPPPAPPPIPAPAAAPAAEPPPRPAPAPVPPPSWTAPAPEARPDFATNLGPRILVATGALAFMVFLGLFVKYAWENDWVGPAGRVLAGFAFGLGLLAAGIRIIRREYRPLGQGLAAAGLAGLYTSAFGAHAFYGLVPREVSGLVMVAVTASAVLLALRLDTRLLALLAWIGAYLTPVLLSTGEDRALALFLYLAVLDAGALFIDQRKPWPETAPLAMAGTVLLYAGWYERFFTPARFEVAAFGLVLFTALFGLGMARKARGPGLGVVVMLAGLGIAVIAAGADRPLPLLVLSLLLGAAALRASETMGRGLAAVALLAAALPLLAWSASHYREDAFGIAAVWVLLAALVFVLPSRLGAAGAAPALEPFAVVGAGVASVLLFASTDRPLPMAAFLVAMAGLAVLVRERWPLAEAVGIASAVLSVRAWMGGTLAAGRAGDAVLLAAPALGVFLIALLVRGLVARRPLAGPDVAAHLLLALGGWWLVYETLEAARPSLEGPAAAAIAAAYLAFGLVARRAPERDLRLVRVALGLAAGFLTLAIPIQLGRHGITLAWAAEGALLIALGMRFASSRTRAAGYAVLSLAAFRLLAFHYPLHAGAFRPVVNPAFGTWLAVAAALALALVVTRDARRAGEALDRAAGPLAAAGALVVLFALLTGETGAAFAQRRSAAELLGDVAAAESARRASGLAVSVLWTVFATGLLAGGLAARNRPLFYAAYGLFAVTAGKVLVWDLQTFSTPYRMLAFLALGLLLMAGAYLNLRFRQRMLPAGAHEA
jgi:uncharacterized membrane protein